MPDAVIVDCLRTPVGKATRGALRNTRPDDLAATVVRALLAKYPQVPKEDVEDVDHKIARCLKVSPATTWPAWSPCARACLSPPQASPSTAFAVQELQSIAMASIAFAPAAPILIAGGSESMSMIPMAGNKPAPNPWFVDRYPQVYINMQAHR